MNTLHVIGGLGLVAAIAVGWVVEGRDRPAPPPQPPVPPRSGSRQTEDPDL